MSTEIQSVSDVRMKYIRGLTEDRREREQSQVEVLEDGEQQTDAEPQAAEADSERKLPAAKRSWFRALTAALGVLYLLILTAIIVRYILVRLENEQLRYNLNNQMEEVTVIDSSGLQDEVKKLTDENTDIRLNNSRLEDDVKKLKTKIEGKSCPEGWKRFGCSCYFKSTQKKDWYDSRDDCVEKGAHLVIITSEEEQEFITNLNRNGDSWIGLREVYEQGGYTWRWVDGSALTQGFWATGLSGSTRYQLYAACCDDQGKWTRDYNYQKTWICEK